MQLRQPGVDEHRLERRRPCDDSLDPEMILERHLGVGHWVPAARGLAQLERALAVGERRLQGAPPLHLLSGDRTAEQERPNALDAVHDADGRPLERPFQGHAARYADAPAHRDDPDSCGHAGGDQAEADRHERPRAEDGRGGEGGAAEEKERGAPPHHTGAGVLATASRTASAAVMPVERASGARIRRCASTGSATDWMSSGST